MEHSTSLTNFYFRSSINRLFYAVVLKNNNSPALSKNLQYSFSLTWLRKKVTKMRNEQKENSSYNSTDPRSPITSWEIEGETVETVSDFILGGSKITADGDCSHEIKRWLLVGIHWKDWCWSWNSSTLATSCEELTHWKRRWCWEGMGAGGE